MITQIGRENKFSAEICKHPYEKEPKGSVFSLLQFTQLTGIGDDDESAARFERLLGIDIDGDGFALFDGDDIDAVFLSEIQLDEVLACPFRFHVDLHHGNVLGKRDHVDKAGA